MSILFKKNSLKYILVRLTLPAQEAVIGQTISVALGQYGVKTQNFVKEFNDKTTVFLKGLEITSYVKVFKDGSFEIFLKGPKVSHVLKIFYNNEVKENFSENQDNLKKELLINIVPIVFQIRPDLKISNNFSIAKTLFSSLKGKEN